MQTCVNDKHNFIIQVLFVMMLLLLVRGRRRVGKKGNGSKDMGSRECVTIDTYMIIDSMISHSRTVIILLFCPPLSYHRGLYHNYYSVHPFPIIGAYITIIILSTPFQSYGPISQLLFCPPLSNHSGLYHNYG